MSKFLSLIFIFLFSFRVFPQKNALGTKALDEFLRRKSLVDNNPNKVGFIIRSFTGSPDELTAADVDTLFQKKIKFQFLPIYLNTFFSDKRPFTGLEYGLIPARGSQVFFSTGFSARFSVIHIQFQPEFVFAQNLNFPGISTSFSSNEIIDRFYYWNISDNPEKLGSNQYNKFFLGQSSISLHFKAFEFGIGTKNFWWGPGQWNSLIFSNNAPGFPHISLNTSKPAKTFLGHFEGQMLIGRLESSNQAPTQNDELNSGYFSPLISDWRYLNALMLSYSPKWIPCFSFGYARTYQYYNSERPKDLNGWLPVLEPMAKEKLFTNGNSVVYDDRRQSQQISVFGRYKMKEAKAEVYFQFGRRDHALNWREFFLNPEHARAYQVGFIKLADLPTTPKVLQIRGEITHQQESVNRYLRYDLKGGLSWHTHGQVRGFTNFGQPMGVGIGTGSNVQTLEVSLVENWSKWGILFERLENNQDFYYRAFGQQNERKPWIDWSTALVWNSSWKNFFVSTKIQGVYAVNYQWEHSEKSSSEFPVNKNLFSIHSQFNLIYFWNKDLKKEKK